MKFVFIHVEKAGYPVRMLCRVLAVSASGYYAWVDRPVSARTTSDAQLAVEGAGAHHRSRGTYGSPRVHAELAARGVKVGKKRVARFMRVKGIAARRKRRHRRTTDSNHTNRVLGAVFTHLASRRLAVREVLCRARGDASCSFVAVPHGKRDALEAVIAGGERDIAAVVRTLQRESVRG